MDLKQLSKVLEKLYNTMGNQYLVDNFITEPFEFNVNVRRGGDEDLHNYVVEIDSFPKMPKSLKYKPEVIKKDNLWVDAADKSVIVHDFKKMIDYIDTSFGSFGKTIGVKFI